MLGSRRSASLASLNNMAASFVPCVALLLPPISERGELPSEIEKVVCIRLVCHLNTACCERGFSRMGLIKSALRNRLYIETLDALMTIGLIGPMFVNILDDEDTVLLAALDEWKADGMRNPNNARFGKKSAAKKKKPMRESRTLVAHQCIYRHQIRGFAVLQRPRGAAFLT